MLEFSAGTLAVEAEGTEFVAEGSVTKLVVGAEGPGLLFRWSDVTKTAVGAGGPMTVSGEVLGATGSSQAEEDPGDSSGVGIDAGCKACKSPT